MPDISKIRINDINYNIKDEIARQDINKLKIKNALFIGDSYTGGWTPDEGTLPENQCFWYKFANLLKITNFQAFNMGGIGFYQKVNNINFLQLLKNNMSNIEDKEIIDAIFVLGGYNDAWENTTTKTVIQNAIGDFMTYIQENFPNAKVYISQIGCNTNLTDEGSRIRSNLLDNITKGYADNATLDYIYLPNMEIVLHDKALMSSDGIHPSSYGHTVLATALFQAFTKGYNFNFIIPESFTPEPYDESDSTSGSIYSYNDGKLKYMRFSSLFFGFETSPTLNHNSGYIIGKNNSRTLLPNYHIPIPVFCHIADKNENHYFVNATLEFTNNYLTLKIHQIVNNNWLEITNVHYIEIMDKDIVEDVHFI